MNFELQRLLTAGEILITVIYPRNERSCTEEQRMALPVYRRDWERQHDRTAEEHCQMLWKELQHDRPDRNPEGRLTYILGIRNSDVGDIYVVKDGDTERHFLCAPTGWKEISKARMEELLAMDYNTRWETVHMREL